MAVTRGPECQECGGPTRVSPNPYFRTGLSVHSEVAVCGRCGTTAFVPVAAAPRPAAEVRRTLPDIVRGVLAKRSKHAAK